MKIRLLSLFTLVLSLSAQQGYPLTGTWTGDWGTSPTKRTPITFVMNWDGKNVTGQINPGPDSIPLSSVYVDFSNWSVRIEAKGKEPISAEGRLADIGAYHRTIKGTWHQGNATGDFRLTRD